MPHHAQTAPRRQASRLTALTFIVALAGAGCPILAAAQDSGGLRITLGAGVGTGPAYPGSGESRTRVRPFLDARWGRWYVGPVPGGSGLGIGATLWESGGLRIGAAISSDLGDLRRERDDRERLAGVGDVEGTQRAQLYARYGFGRYALTANVASDIGDRDLGTLATLEAEARFQLAPALTLSVGPGLTWGSSEYQRTLFGINAEQSAASGYSRYSPDGGLAWSRLSAGLQWRVDPRWSLGVRAGWHRLEGDAADSPLVEHRSRATGAFYVLYSL